MVIYASRDNWRTCFQFLVTLLIVSSWKETVLLSITVSITIVFPEVLSSRGQHLYVCFRCAFVLIKHATHREITQHAILSEMACLTPFSDYNQSPRNMYQCQVCMASSSMCHTGCLLTLYFTLWHINSCHDNGERFKVTGMKCCGSDVMG